MWCCFSTCWTSPLFAPLRLWPSVNVLRSSGRVTEILAASTDSHFSHLAWINTEKKQGGLGPMKIPLLADPTQAISRDYGVLKEDEGIAYRGLFVIYDIGILRQIPINDLPVACSVDETLRLVQAFQHTDKFGEACPAGWRPGHPEEQGVFLQRELIHPHLLRGATSIQRTN